jgi:hypothetical protein
MLLHVVEAAWPVHSSRHPVRDKWSIEQVRDPVTLVDHVRDAHASELPGIERLATRRGIERGPVEIDAPRAVESINDGGLKITGVRIGIIDSVGHREPGPGM